jgi:hypothetical protein
MTAAIPTLADINRSVSDTRFEPIADDRPEDNMYPVGRLYYNASTMICVPTSLDQEVGEGLGAQAGEIKVTEVIRDDGFAQVRTAFAGPFNMVLEARV